jgi:hypothetical protein
VSIRHTGETRKRAFDFLIGNRPSRSGPGARCLVLAMCAGLVGLALNGVQAQTAIPSTFVLPSSAADTEKPGFNWRIHQVASSQPDSNARTEAQLAGLLGDNIADPNAQSIAIAPASPADPATAPLMFEIATVINMNVLPGRWAGNFPDDQMPGLPNVAGGFENVAGEVTAWLELPAGEITLGVNSDDGFRMTLGGSRPNDQFASFVGEFNGLRAAGDTIFTFSITEAGLYPMRCTWEQGTVEGSLEIFSVNPDGSRVLVNDVWNGGIPAYRAVTTPLRAYARRVSPAPGATGVDPLAPVVVELVDGGTAIAPESIQLSVDGTAVSAVLSKAGDVTTITFNRSVPYASGSQHEVALTYTEGASQHTANWTFRVALFVGPNGHLYEVVHVPAGITWPEAKIAAENRTFLGLQGYLATITSAEEDVYLEQLRQASLPSRGLGQLWVGGYQVPNSEEPGGGWLWLNDEGPIAPINGGSTYANWLSGQPDNFWTHLGGSEDYLAIGLYNGFGWNDDGFFGDGLLDGTLGAYVVEYDRLVVPIDIKPGVVPNSIALDSYGKIAVAILSGPLLDAATVDRSTVRFGRTGHEASPVSHSFADINQDSMTDLILQFEIQEAAFVCNDTRGILRAKTLSGTPIQGSDSIQTIRCPPYALAVQVVQDAQQTTDVLLKWTSLLPGYTAPSIAKKLKFKSVNGLGLTESADDDAKNWAQMFHDFTLTVNADNTSGAMLQFQGPVHGQQIETTMDVTDSTGATTWRLRHSNRVLFKPDLALTALMAPSQARTRQVVNISASLRELKGDLGSTANVDLMEGDAVLDSVQGVTLGALGSAGITFAAVFTTAGQHQLKIVVSELTVGDYDVSNNEQGFVIDVVQPLIEPVFTCVNFSRFEQDYRSVAENPYWIQTFQQQYTNEYTSQTLYIPEALQSPIGGVFLQISADGVEKNNFEAHDIPLFPYYSDGCSSYSSGSEYLGDNVYIYFQTSQDCFGNTETTASFTKFGEKVNYFSSFYDKVWGTLSESPTTYESGTLVNPANSLQTYFVVQSGEGTFGGEAAITSFAREPWDYNWDYMDFETRNTGYDRGQRLYGGACDFTTP